MSRPLEKSAIFLFTFHLNEDRSYVFFIHHSVQRSAYQIVNILYVFVKHMECPRPRCLVFFLEKVILF